MVLQNVETVWLLKWNDQHTYGELKLRAERDYCKYNFEAADVPMLLHLFDVHEGEVKRLLKEKLVFPAYDHTVKCSHLFNLLDARRAISTTERERFIQRVQDLARGCARAYFASLKKPSAPERAPVSAE